ncbi:hypothetical protein A9Q87_07495 [Flavobacteriales bacterium 34_180_T64]|nr:hypothetical protein A9Q87_07495 [Flavobacteriales bacterium 34_180_T64]
MNKTATLTWVILIGLTVASAVFSIVQNSYIVLIILVLAVLKFIGIAFQFMELKKAHVFWKIIVCIFLFIFLSTILIVN